MGEPPNAHLSLQTLKPLFAGSGLTKHLFQLQKFTDVFGQQRLKCTGFPDTETIKLGFYLIEEELEELHLAVEDQDLDKTLDAFGDLLYVVLWFVSVCGIDNIEQIFDAIHESNMTKLWTKKEVEEALAMNSAFKLETVVREAYPTDQMEFYDSNMKAYVVKDLRGKVIKSPSYTPFDGKKFIPEAA